MSEPIVFVRQHSDVFAVVNPECDFIGTVAEGGVLGDRWYFYGEDDVRLEASQLRQIADKLDELNNVPQPVCKPCQDDNRANCECE